MANENSDSYTKTLHALPVLFTSSAIRDRVGVEDVLVELAREVMSHTYVPLSRSRRNGERVGDHSRSDRPRDRGQRQDFRISFVAETVGAFKIPVSQQISCMAVMPFPILLTDVCLQSSRRRFTTLDRKDPALTAVARSVRDRERSPARSSLRRAQPSLRVGRALVSRDLIGAR